MKNDIRGRFLDPLRRQKQRMIVQWRRIVGKRWALRGVKPLTSDAARCLPTFCVSLQSDEAKRRFMQLQAERLGLCAFSFLDAIDGRSISKEDFEKQGVYDDALAQRYENSSVSAANIALCLSHFRLWKAIANAGWPAVMILEDDAVFHGKRIASVDPSSFPAEWDVVFLDAYIRHKPPRGQIQGTLFSMESYRGGTAGYIISASGARKLLRMASVPVCHPIDGYMGWYNHHRLENIPPWKGMELPPLHEYLIYPRPITNGSLFGFWPSSIGKSMPDY